MCKTNTLCCHKWYNEEEIHMGKFWDKITLMSKAGEHLKQCCPRWVLLGSSEFEYKEEDLKWGKFNTYHEVIETEH
jgi:hypothetical protein